MQSSIYEALLRIGPDLLTAVEQHPLGATVLVGLAVYALSCPVAIAWLKYRRR
jgi:hypothetical protein